MNQDPNYSDAQSPYAFLLEFEWPEHIDKILRRLMWLGLNAAHETELDNSVHEGDLELADHIAAQLCWLIAVCPDSPGAVLHSFAHNIKSAALLERVAENPKTAEETLRVLAEYAAPRIRLAVATNPKTPKDVLTKLCSDESVDVRYALAEDPHLSEDMLHILADDDNCYVAARALGTLRRVNPAPPVTLNVRQAGNNSEKRLLRRFG